MKRFRFVVVLIPALFLLGCGGESPESTGGEQPSAVEGQTTPEKTPVFEDDFETGEADEWSKGDEEPTPTEGDQISGGDQ